MLQSKTDITMLEATEAGLKTSLAHPARVLPKPSYVSEGYRLIYPHLEKRLYSASSCNVWINRMILRFPGHNLGYRTLWVLVNPFKNMKYYPILKNYFQLTRTEKKSRISGPAEASIIGSKCLINHQTTRHHSRFYC